MEVRNSGHNKYCLAIVPPGHYVHALRSSRDVGQAFEPDVRLESLTYGTNDSAGSLRNQIRRANCKDDSREVYQALQFPTNGGLRRVSATIGLFMNDQTEYYLSEARTGAFDAAYHGLIELPDHLVPDLEEAYRSEADPKIRALIVEAIWQHRLPASVDFLAAALADPHPEVWKQALDGLVVLASPQSRDALELAKSRVPGQNGAIRAWIEEAIAQLDESTGPGL